MKKHTNPVSRIPFDVRYFLFITCVCLLSCKAQKESKPIGQEINDLVLIDQDDFSTITDYEVRVIQDQKSLQKFYTKINMTRKPGLPVPTVDFSKNLLILVCLGEQRKEADPLLSKLQETDARVSIAVQLIEKEQVEQTSTQLIYYPFYLFKMPIIDKGISFQKFEN